MLMENIVAALASQGEDRQVRGGGWGGDTSALPLCSRGAKTRCQSDDTLLVGQWRC